MTNEPKIKLSEFENPYELLDFILMELLYTTEIEPRTMDEIHWTAGIAKVLDNRDRYILFEKLMNDKYIAIKQTNDVPPKPINDSSNKWYIMFEGILLLRNKGYIQQQKNYH